MVAEFTAEEEEFLAQSAPELPSARPEDTLLGALLVAEGALSALDIDKVLVAQRKSGLRFGEAAQKLGLVKADHVQAALALQFGYPIVGGNGAHRSALDPRLFMACDPFGAQAEAVRNLRSELMLRWFSDKRKLLAVIAPRTGTGCSSVAANLAIGCAQIGERTLLIDADLRFPRQGPLFGIADEAGLAAVLDDRIALKGAIARVPGFEHLSVLTAGPSVPNPQELLSRVHFAYAMETAPGGFDVVIVDTPPLLESADAQLIAARAGGCVLVTRRNVTRMDDIAQCKRRLQPTHATLLGMVINE
jgi:protein-tyrosine kinase